MRFRPGMLRSAMSIETPTQPTDVFERTRTNEVEQRGEVLNNLLSVSSYLTSVLDPDELLTSLARRVVEVVPAVQAGLLWLYDRHQSALRVASTHGIDLGASRELPMRLRMRPGVGLAGVVLQRGEPMLIEGRGRYREMTIRTSPSPN